MRDASCVIAMTFVAPGGIEICPELLSPQPTMVPSECNAQPPAETATTPAAKMEANGMFNVKCSRAGRSKTAAAATRRRMPR